MGCNSQQFFQPPSLTAVHDIPESLISGNYQDSGVLVALPVTSTNEKM